MIAAAPVRIDGAYNARIFGMPQAWLLRSSALDSLTPSGLDDLAELGIGRVIDLREPGEGGVASHDVETVHAPIYRASGVPLTGRLESVYDHVLEDRGDALAEAVSAIADAEGPVAVHCTIGKDRTGLVVALTLLAAGAPKEDVIADYVLSGPEVLPHRRAYVERALAGLELSDADRAETWRLNVQSPPEAMEHAISRLDEWGGAAAYLASHGVTRRQLAALRERL